MKEINMLFTWNDNYLTDKVNYSFKYNIITICLTKNICWHSSYKLEKRNFHKTTIKYII